MAKKLSPKMQRKVIDKMLDDLIRLGLTPTDALHALSVLLKTEPKK
jgi:hypothetical protein